MSEWRDLLLVEGGAGGDRTMENAVQHGAAAFVAGLQATGPSDDDARSRAEPEGAWGYGKRCAFPTSPHPRLRLRTIFQQSVTLSCSACPESQIGRSRSEGRPKHALGVQSRKLRFPQGQGHAGLYLALRAMRLAAFAGFERDFSFHQLIRCCSMSVSEFIRVPVASTTRKVEGRNDG